MELFERIKIIRGFLKQEEFASKLGVSKVTIGRWERGERVPDAQDLFKISVMFPEFNPTWILTGEGDMMRYKPSGWWAEKIKEIRGDLSISEFVKKANFQDEKYGRTTIRAIEEGKIEPDWGLLVMFSQELGINPTWMIDGDGPMYKGQVLSGNIAEVNQKVLAEILEEAEVYESLNPGTLLPWKKAQLIAELYQMRMEKLDNKNEDAD